MTRLICAGGLGDALRAFFGFLLGLPVPDATTGETILGGAIVLGGFLLLFLLGGLLLLRVKMPLPPEEREPEEQNNGDTPEKQNAPAPAMGEETPKASGGDGESIEDRTEETDS